MVKQHQPDGFGSFRVARRQFLRGGASTGLVLGAASPASLFLTDRARAAEEGTLRLRLLADVQNLDPAFEPQDYDLQVIFNIYEKLVSFEPGTFNMVNTLAESWSVSDDGLAYDFALKQGIPFHKGYGEVTAEDVKFSFERIAGLTEPPIESPYRKLWSTLKSVEVTGKYSGTILLNEVFAPLMTLTVPGNVGQVVSKKAVEELGDGFATNPVGTGPYEFVEWRPRERVVLRRFEEYGGAAYDYAPPVEWNEIHFLPIPEDSTAEIALETGEVDFSELPLPSVGAFQDREGFEVTSRTGFGYKWIGMNVNDPVMSDIRVRKAIRSAIDVPSILAAAYEGLWQRATAIIPPSMPLGHWPDAPVHEQDVEAAKALLQEAGATDLSLTFEYNKSEPGADSVAAIVQQNLREIGIDVEVVGLENAVAMETGEGAQDRRQIFYIGYGSQGDPHQSMTWFTCDQIDKWNFLDWCDEEFSRLYAEGVATTEPARREEIYLEMQRLWEDQANIIWIAWPTSFFAFRQGIEPELRPDGRMIAWDFRHA